MNARRSVLVVLLVVMTSSLGFSGTFFLNTTGDGLYYTEGNWSNGLPSHDNDGRIRGGNHAYIDETRTAANSVKYNMYVGFGSKGSLTVNPDCQWKMSYRRKLYVGEINTTEGEGTVNIYGTILLTSPQAGLDSYIVMGVGNNSVGYVNVFDGGFLNAQDNITCTQGKLVYEAHAVSSTPRNEFKVAANGVVLFETDADSIATVDFNGTKGLSKLTLSGKAGMELSGEFSIAQTWMLFKDVEAWSKVANNETILSDQGYTFKFNKDTTAGTASVTLTEAGVVQMNQPTSRDLPLDTTIDWGLGTIDPNGFDVYYDVYFGTDPNTDNNTQYVFKDNVTTFKPSDYPDAIDYKTTYYVRVDVYDPNDSANPDNDILVRGGAWKLKTINLDPIVTAHPADISVDRGSQATFTAAGDLTDYYQWYKADAAGPTLITNGGDISGADTPTLVIDNVEAADEGDYYCVLSSATVGNIAEVPTDSAALSLNAILTGPDDVSVDLGGTAEFTVDYSIATGYSWYRDADPDNPLVDGGDISGATTATLKIANVDTTDADDYYCVVAVNDIFKTSGKARLSINNLIVSGPEDTSAFPTETARFTVVSPLATDFEWRRAGESNAIENGGDISGAATATLTIANAEAADEGEYYCVVSSSIYSIEETSANAKLTVKRLIGYWDFENDPNDQAGGLVGEFYNGNSPTDPLEFFNDANSVTGDPGDMINGNALRLTGDGTYIRALDSETAYNFYTDGFTFSAWIKITNKNINHKVLAKQNDAASKGFHIMTTAARGRVRLFNSDGYSQSDNMGPNTHNGRWHLITGTSDAKVLRVYIDGNLEESTDISNETIPVHNSVFVIGAGNDNGSYPFDGLIDEVKAYNYALDHDEIAQTYADGVGKNACKEYTASDRNRDCFVDLADFARLAADPIDLDALAVMAAEWLDAGNIIEPATE